MFATSCNRARGKIDQIRVLRWKYVCTGICLHWKYDCTGNIASSRLFEDCKILNPRLAIGCTVASCIVIVLL